MTKKILYNKKLYNLFFVTSLSVDSNIIWMNLETSEEYLSDWEWFRASKIH